MDFLIMVRMKCWDHVLGTDYVLGESALIITVLAFFLACKKNMYKARHVEFALNRKLEYSCLCIYTNCV